MVHARQDLSRSWKPWLRGTAFGFPLGAMPAGGAEIPTFLSYATERKLTKHPEEFGKGAIEGVAGPEAANNAAAAGVLVPLLTLGIPTSATAAIILAAFQGYGIQTGPTLLTTESGLVWTLIASLLIGNFMLLVLNLPLVGVWVKLLRIPRPYLYAGILMFASLGSYAVNADPLDLVLLLVIGLLGFFMRRYGWPVAPAVIGLILGPIAETNLRRALAISGGDLSVLLDSWVSRIVLLLALIALVGPIVLRLVRGPRSTPEELQQEGTLQHRVSAAGPARQRRRLGERGVMGTVVVGFVPGPRGEAALQHAVEECRRRGARLVVVNTSRGDSLVDDRFLQGEDLERLEADLAAAGVPAELRRPMRGRDVAEELAEVVEETSAELLVIGLRRRSAVGKLLMGSAAQRILLDVECPILAVKAPPR